MPTREKAWCGYCVTAAFASFAILLPRAQTSVRTSSILSGRTRDTVLADPARLRILSLIANHPRGEVCQAEFTRPLGLSQATVSRRQQAR
jgi:hypothetical protein